MSKSKDPPVAAAEDEPLEFAVGVPVPTSTNAVMDSHTSTAGSLAPPSGLAQMYGKVRDSAASVFKDRKPWVEFLDRTAFSKPASVGEVTSRVQKNLHYYRTNYLIFFLATMALTFLTNPKCVPTQCALGCS